MTNDILTDINRIHFIPRMLIITQTQMSPSKREIVWHGRFVDGFQDLPRQFGRVWSSKKFNGFDILLVVLGGSTLIKSL